jgi:hypothetical protein
MAIKLITCLVCNSEFSGSSNALYCSGKCRQVSHRAKINSRGYIYKLISAGEVVYVGQSRAKRSVEDRVISHRSGLYKKNFDDYEYYRVDGESLNEVEAREIIKFNPKYNSILPSNDSYESLNVAAKRFVHDMSEVIAELCETYMLGKEDGKHFRYVKKCDMNELKEMIISKLGRQKEKTSD